MSDQLRDLIRPFGEFEPPLDLHTRIVERERALPGSRREAWHAPRALMIAAAAVGVTLVLLALALAAHSRSSAPQPAKPPLPAPPACAVASGGSGIDCGPASAAIRTAGHWQVLNQGRCVDHSRLYFGVHTEDGDAPLSLQVDIPAGALTNGGGVRVTGGQLELVPGQKELVSGEAVVEPGGKSGAFTVHGQDADGRADGNTYAGAWTCRTGHRPKQVKPQTPQAELPQCTKHELQSGAYAVQNAGGGFVIRDGYDLDCGPGSAIVWAAGRWQVVAPGRCSDYGRIHIGISGDGRADPHRSIGFGMNSAPNSLLLHGGRVAMGDGEIDVLGAHEPLSGRAIVQHGGGGGAFDLYGRSGGTARSGNIYVGAWTCGLPKSLLYTGPL